MNYNSIEMINEIANAYLYAKRSFYVKTTANKLIKECKKCVESLDI